MIKKIRSVLHYIKWLYLKSKTIQSNKSETLRIVEISHDKNGELIIHVQVINKAVFLFYKLSDILENDTLLECFSKKDIITVSLQATKEKYKPKHKIISHYHNEVNKIILGMQMHGSDVTQEMTVSEISKNKKLLNAISQEDAHIIGYLMGVEQMIMETDSLKSISLD